MPSAQWGIWEREREIKRHQGLEKREREREIFIRSQVFRERYILWFRGLERYIEIQGQEFTENRENPSQQFRARKKDWGWGFR